MFTRTVTAILGVVCEKLAWTDLHEIFCADPLWSWLGPPLATLRYVMYFRLHGWRHVWP